MLDDGREHLRAAGTFADSGERARPDIRFREPGTLEKEDYEIIKRQPRLGHGRLGGMRDGDEIALAVLHHQEHFDGKGYPDGLAGADIPAPSRIMAAIAAYAAMTSDRPHRRALSELEARKELQVFAGTQFDPQVVALLMRCDLSL